MSFLNWWMDGLPAVHFQDNINSFKKYLFHPIKRKLAKLYLLFLQKYSGISVIAITGSAGKTTTKEMLAAILKLDGPTVYSKENIDPVYNIPDTILRAEPTTKYLILEMGIEYPGEMDFYLWLAKPDMAVITNIFPTHTAFLGDVEGVFNEKSKLALSLDRNKIVILNSGDERLKNLSLRLKSRVFWFKSDTDPLKQNANAASEVAEILGVSEEKIKKGLLTYGHPPHRLNLFRAASGAHILDDSYNSNPWAAISTLNYFNGIAKGNKVAVLGDMLELGSYDEKGHRELGREVANSHFAAVVGIGQSSKFLIDEVGKRSKSTRTYLFPDSKKALPMVRSLAGNGVYIMVKGSRSMGLDKIIDALR